MEEEKDIKYCPDFSIALGAKTPCLKFECTEYKELSIIDESGEEKSKKFMCRRHIDGITLQQLSMSIGDIAACCYRVADNILDQEDTNGMIEESKKEKVNYIH